MLQCYNFSALINAKQEIICQWIAGKFNFSFSLTVIKSSLISEKCKKNINRLKKTSFTSTLKFGPIDTIMPQMQNFEKKWIKLGYVVNFDLLTIKQEFL